jgi:hypothetical protein
MPIDFEYFVGSKLVISTTPQGKTLKTTKGPIQRERNFPGKSFKRE